MNESIQFLTKVMDAAALRHRVLANNLANADTPRFRRQDVRFREMLARAVESGSGEKLAAVKPEIYEDTTALSRPDGNSVSLQKEMGEIAENALLYQFASKAVDRKFETLKKAIRGR